MKSTLGTWSLTLLLAVAGVEIGFAANGVAAGGQMKPAGQSLLAASLAAQVSEIANSPMISHAKKEKRISTAVRVAVVAATAYKQDGNEILGIAIELSAAAAKAAPHFAEVIAKAVSFVPSVERIDGAAGQIRAAAFAAAKAPKPRREVKISTAAYAETPIQSQMPAEIPAAQSGAGRPSGIEEPATLAATENPANQEMPSPSDASAALSLSQKRNTSFYLTAQVGARYDDNIFLSDAGKVGDTIMTVAPGVEFQYGKNSIAHGSVVYQEAFQKYLGDSVTNATLGTGNADFAYDDGHVTAAAAASFQQLYQNNVDVLTLGTRELVRSDLFGLNGSVESQLGVKLSAKGGADFTWTDYKTPGLVSNQYTDWPIKLYYKATPKVDLSTGLTYGIERPDGGGPNARDLFYNVGARGSFTPKLSGEFSVGYQTRAVENNPLQKLLGLDGTLNYELTPKTSSALVFSRQFTASALGQSLENSRYSFSLSTDVTAHWQIGASVTYQDVDYGAAVYTVENQPLLTDRRDKSWEPGLFAGLSYSNWLTATANYTFRNNHSTLSEVDFSDDVLSLMLSFRY